MESMQRLMNLLSWIVPIVVLTIIGTHFRGPNWAFYWSPADWPGH